MKKPLFVVFDGNALVHRAFHALPPFTLRKTGEIVGAVYGFASILLKVLNDLKPTHYAIAFDKKAPTFRHQMYDQYKATRKETPEDLSVQFGRVRQVVRAFNIPIYELDGYEADDVLGTLARQASEQSIDTVVVTGDADTMQLVTPKVKVLYPRPRGNFSDADQFDEAAVVAKYGIKPEQIADFKALKGDPSDNIPGVRGIGDKTAVKLIQEFGSLEQMYDNIDKVVPEKTQALLREQEQEARRSKVLATIVTDSPVKLNLDEALASKYDRNRVAELFRELEFFSLVNKLPGEVEAKQLVLSPDEKKLQADDIPYSYRIISTSTELDQMVTRLSGTASFVFGVETTGQNAMLTDVVGLSFSPAPGEAYYIPVGHTAHSTIPQMPFGEVAARLKPLLEAKKPKTAHDGKFGMTVLAENGIELNNLAFDTMVASYLLCEQALTLKALAFNKLGVEMTAVAELTGTGAKQVPLSQVDIEKVRDYSCADADMTGRLAAILTDELRKQDLWQLFDEVEMPLVPVLMAMERSGILLDTGRLAQMSRDLGEQLAGLEKQIYSLAGHDFNINSPKQLGNVLFEELKIPAAKKKGVFSTGADILEALREYPIINLILDYRQLSKLKSTYVDALPGLVNPGTGRVHTNFNQTRTTTGRLSSSDPNLQNIPIRGELGRKVRDAFIAPEGCRLLGADYSQIDLRSLAHLSKDENLMQAFLSDEDIHSATAAQLYGVEKSNVTADMRRLAKTVNFGVIYGMSEYGLEQATELSREDAGKFIRAYFDKYPGVKQYLEATKQQARKTGYVQTILGRKRYIPEINAANRQVREAAERMAINMPVQGTSADIIKKAMIDIHKEMERRHLRSKMLLQVHDELVFEVPDDEMEEMKRMATDLMCSAIKLDVPLKVDTKVGRNWGEME